MSHHFLWAQLQIANTFSQDDDFLIHDVVEPLAVTFATILIIVITFYLSSLKHELLDASLEKPYKIKRKKIYTRLLKLIPSRFRVVLLGS